MKYLPLIAAALLVGLTACTTPVEPVQGDQVDQVEQKIIPGDHRRH